MNKSTMNSGLLNMLGRMALAALMFSLAWAVVAGNSSAQPPATVRVLAPTTPVAVGQTFTVSIVVENADNLGAYEFEYNFIPAIASATVNDIQLASLLGSTGRTTGVLRLNSAPGKPNVPLFGAYSYGSASGPSGGGVLATVTMTAVSPGASLLNLSGLKITDTTGQEMSAVATASTVTIGGSVPNSIYVPLLRRNSGS